jgi:hypothetical protein
MSSCAEAHVRETILNSAAMPHTRKDVWVFFFMIEIVHVSLAKCAKFCGKKLYDTER